MKSTPKCPVAVGVRRSLGKARDACQNLIRTFGPDKGFGIGILRVEEFTDGTLQLAYTAMRSTPDLFGR
jgi:hypothetical protein